MKRRAGSVYGLVVLLFLVLSAGCGVPGNNLPLYQRSMVIQNPQAEQAVLARASLEVRQIPRSGTPVKVLYLRGTPYEMGFQHGTLLRDDVRSMYKRLIGLLKFKADVDILDEVYDLMAPYIPSEEQEEMRGLAHGADVPLRVVHWIHAIPGVFEYGPKKRFLKGGVPTSCSNLVAFDRATANGELYHLRVLDWARYFHLQNWPVVLVHRPETGHASVTFSYAGFIGAVTGMNDQQLTFGEMGYGNPPGESLEGIPFVFLFRKMMREADSIEEIRRTIESAQRTNSYVFVFGDAKQQAGPAKGRLFIADRGRVLNFAENTDMVDEREGGDSYPAIENVVYGGARGEVLHGSILEHYGTIDPEVLKKIAAQVSLKSNLHNVILRPRTMEAWFSNASLARGVEGKASSQPWLHLDFSEALRD
jgi:hypothetical protein